MKPNIFSERVFTSSSQILRSRYAICRASAFWHPEHLLPSFTRPPQYNKQVFNTSVLLFLPFLILISNPFPLRKYSTAMKSPKGGSKKWNVLAASSISNPVNKTYGILCFLLWNFKSLPIILLLFIRWTVWELMSWYFLSHVLNEHSG